jgi:long-chain acyl-CoA synthetase
MVVVPRILERLYESMTIIGDHAKGPKSLFIKSAIKLAKLSDPEKRKTPMQRLYDKLVYKKMRDALGGNFKLLISGGSALNKSILRFLLNIGLPVYEGFGMTECSTVISVNSPFCSKPGSIGKPLPYLSVRIGDQNEIQVKGESVFRGYRNKPELNAQIFTEDGFYKTGDQGFFDED